MQKISAQCIEDEYQLAIHACAHHFPVEKWSVKPVQLKLTNCKTKYGIASIDGTVYINSAFIGTSAINKLRNTLRHELAHLAVGISHQHDAVFRKCERLFGADVKVSPEEIAEFEKNIPHKWLLLAHLVNGKSTVLGGAHRKHKKYAKYRPNIFRALTIDGIKVDRFEYLSNE